MTQLMLLALTFALHAGALPLTLPFDPVDDGSDRPVRPLDACQWLDADLYYALTPDARTVGAGSILRINAPPEIKMLRDKMTAEWEPVDALVAYADHRDLETRYHELQELHFEKDVFYETTDHLAEMLARESGFALAPGARLVVTTDPALMRFIFANPTVEFVVLEPVVIDGATVLRPTGRRGVLPFEVLRRSAQIVRPPDAPTHAARRGGKNCDGALRAGRR